VHGSFSLLRALSLEKIPKTRKKKLTEREPNEKE
jgi:hypothetical protein